MVDHTDASINNAQSRPEITDFYNFEPVNKDASTYLDYIPQNTQQDFNIFHGNSNQEQFSAGLANEYLPYMWIMYKVYGAHTFTMRSSLEEDLPEFGGFIVSPYWADVEFKVDEDGNFEFSCKHKFEHATTRGSDRVVEQEVPREDMSFDWIEHNLTGNISQFNGVENESIE